jgi:hypothetical protein
MYSGYAMTPFLTDMTQASNSRPRGVVQDTVDGNGQMTGSIGSPICVQATDINGNENISDAQIYYGVGRKVMTNNIKCAVCCK